MPANPSLTAADLRALVSTANELSKELDLADLLAKILASAGELTDSEAGSVMLFDERRAGLYFAAATGPTAASVLTQFGENGERVVPIQNSKAGAVFESGLSLAESEVQSDPNHFAGVDERVRNQTRSLLCVPLSIGAERLGVVQLINQREGSYTARHTLLLEHFASHAAVAIRNARSFQTLLSHMGLHGEGLSPTELVRQLDQPAREERMTLMMADMRSFTALAQTIRSPQAVQRLLSEFLTTLVEAVLQEKGVVNKFMGDGLLAMFRGENTELRAVSCAFDMLARCDALFEAWNGTINEDISFVDIGIGLVTDEVIIGSVGSKAIRDFTPIGTPVNLAAAFEFAARGGRRILCDQATLSGARDLVGESEGPTDYELIKPGQPRGIHYKQYHLQTLRPRTQAGGAPAGVAISAQDPSLRRFYNDSWAVIVGVDHYESRAIERLECAVADAEAIAEVLPQIGFSADKITVLKNEQATRAALHQALFGNLHRMNAEDRLFVFLALHGETVQTKGRSEGYLMPYDADKANLPGTAFAMSDLSRIGDRLPVKHVMFALDSCFSGYAARRGGTATERNLMSLVEQPVVQVLTAGSTGQSAFEEAGHGIFTRHLIAGLLGGADPSGEGLTALKLGAFVQDRVVQESEGDQVPQYSKLRGEGEFLFLPPRE